MMSLFVVDDAFSQLVILGQTSLAMALGALIGLDREYSKKPAGLRTHILVAGAAAILVRLAERSVLHFSRIVDVEMLQADPTRIFVAVVTGISFLGAGTIIRDRKGNQVQGLTTAASLLFAAVIGMTVAFEQYILAIGSTVLVIVTLWMLGRLSNRMERRSNAETKRDGGA